TGEDHVRIRNELDEDLVQLGPPEDIALVGDKGEMTSGHPILQNEGAGPHEFGAPVGKIREGRLIGGIWLLQQMVGEKRNKVLRKELIRVDVRLLPMRHDRAFVRALHSIEKSQAYVREDGKVPVPRDLEREEKIRWFNG